MKSNKVVIPTNRPVLGSDLLELQKALDASTAEMHYILCMTPNEWADTVNAGRDEPIKSIPVEIIVRVLDESPELSPIPQPPDPNEIYELVKGIRDMGMGAFAELCGSEQTAAVRWLTQQRAHHPKSSRVFEVLLGRLTRGKNPLSRADRLYNWELMVFMIGRAREVAVMKVAEDAASNDTEPIKETRAKAARKVSSNINKAARQRKQSAK